MISMCSRHLAGSRASGRLLISASGDPNNILTITIVYSIAFQSVVTHISISYL
jgi:hypothetical protein